MNVLLVEPAVGFYDRTMSTPLGLLSIGSYLKFHGHNVRILDRSLEKTTLKTVCGEFSPDVVGVSVMSSRGLSDAIGVSKLLKSFGLTVVWGGQLPTFYPELVVEKEYVDIVSVGEGEETWLELLERFSAGRDVDDVLGVVYKKDGRVVRTPCRPFSDLGSFPPTDWSLIDVPKYMQTYIGCKKMMYLYSSKGCPGRCAFCSNVTYHKSTHRDRPNGQVVAEIRYLYENYGLDGVYFSDEVWRLRRSDMQDFCRRMKEEDIPVRWGVDLRVGIFNEEDYRLMYDAGCRWIFFGIESGSREMQKLIHKNINYDAIKPTVELLNRIGYTTMSSFIVGFPDETEQQLRDTAEMLNDLPIGLTPIFHFTPLPGTELYEKLVSDGRLIPPRRLEDLLEVIPTETLGVNYSAVPDRDLKVVRNWFHWKSFTKKNAIRDSKPFEFARQTIKSTLNEISKMGFRGLFANVFSAAFEFLYVFWYSHMFPGIKKKYGLR